MASERKINAMFIMKRNSKEIVTSPLVRTRFKEVHRTKRIVGEEIGFPIREVEHAGWDKKQLSISMHYPQNGFGIRSSSGYGPIVPRTAAGVKAGLRRVRPQESEQIESIDNKIKALQTEIKELREQRKEVVREAWTKAHVVRLQEIDPLEDKREVRDEDCEESCPCRKYGDD